MNVLQIIVILFLRILAALVHPIYIYRSAGKRKLLPPMKSDILKISATDLAAKIRRKELSSEEICRAYIERIKEVNPFINAVVEERYEEAIRDAKNVDKYLIKCSLNEEELEKTKPLLGVPLTVKESCSLKGMKFSVGSLSREGYKAESEGEIVSRLKSSGAIPLLVSNTPELCLSFECSNMITGCTNNPYDTTCTSGGSSGGEGALLGAGASVIGIGSDIAGSIRVPAMYNCIFGHKPTPRIASIKGNYPHSQDEKILELLVIGPMTRYAKDLSLMMNIIVDPKQKPQLRLNEKVNLSKLNVFFMEDSGNKCVQPVQKEIKKAILCAAKYLKTKCRANIKDYKFNDFKDSIFVCGKILFSVTDIPRPYKKGEVCLEWEFLKSIAGYSSCTSQVLFFLMQEKLINSLVADKKLQEGAIWRQTCIDKLGDNGVLIYPTGGTSANKHNEIYFTLQATTYTFIPSALGLPATNVPCGLDNKGMPIGIQIIAAPNQDRLCLAVAEELEKCFGGWIPPKCTDEL